MRHVTTDGVRWSVPDSDDDYARRFLGGWLPTKEHARARRWARGRVMLDVGANIGQSAIPRLLAGDFERVYCAEPEPRNFAALSETIRENGLEGRIIPYPIALGAEDGEATLMVKPRIATHALAAEGRTAKRGTLAVPLRRLDTWVADLGVDPAEIAFVKSDAQGYDGRVLMGAGALLDRASIAWQIEYRPRGLVKCGTPHEWMLGFLAAHFSHFLDLRRMREPRPVRELAGALAYLLLRDGAFTELVLLHCPE